MSYQFIGSWLIGWDGTTMQAAQFDSSPVFTGECSQEDGEAVLADADPNARVQQEIDFALSADGNSVTVSIVRTIESGLQLKPRTIELALDPGSTNQTLIQQLVTSQRDHERRLAQAEASLEKATQVLSDISEEKQNYEALVLDKVAALLDERNEWVEKFEMLKEEID